MQAHTFTPVVTTFSSYAEHIAEGKRGTLVMFDEPSPEELAMLVLPFTYCPNVADLLDQSNWECIKATLASADPTGEHHQVASFGHWATAYDLMLVKPGTPAHAAAERLMARYANHPVLDENDFSERETLAFEADLASEIRGLTIEVNGVELDAPNGAEYDALFCAVASELTMNETPDNCDRSDLEEALRDLGFTYDASAYTWRGTLPVEPEPTEERPVQAPIVVVNPSDRGNHQERRWFDTKPRFILWFGAHAPRYLMVWGHLEDALEECAEWLADNEPGHIMTHDSDELQELFNEAMGELYPDAESIDSLDEQQIEECQEQATADLTYTEAGYLTSDDWGIALNEHATRADVLAFIAEVGERHYSDGPVCDITR